MYCADAIQYLAGKDDVIVLFLHSFNFLHLPYNFRKGEYGRIGVDEGTMKDAEDLLSWIVLQKNCGFVTINSLRIDSSQDDVLIEISRRGSIKQGMLDALASKVLKVRRA